MNNTYKNTLRKVASAENDLKNEIKKYNESGAGYSVSGAEWVARGAGAIGGGLLGYLLSGLVHRKPEKTLRLLYTLGGAVGGGLAADALIGDKTRKRWRYEANKSDEARAAELELAKEKMDFEGRSPFVWPTVGAIGGATLADAAYIGVKRGFKKPTTLKGHLGASGLGALIAGIGAGVLDEYRPNIPSPSDVLDEGL